jgi:hypothetical protein
MKLSSLLTLFALLSPPALADLKLRPGEKPKESPKDIKKAVQEREKEGYNTPEPLAKEVSYITGQSVVVELEAATASLSPVKFIIREQPQHGILSEIRAHPDSQKANHALVIYTHNGIKTALEDRFTFSAKLNDGFTSSAVAITLKGRIALPVLEVVRAPLFKPLQAGAEDISEFVLKNTGPAAYNEDVNWPPPFMGPPKIVLLPGEEQTYLIKAKPLQPGAYKLKQELQLGNEKAILHGMIECIQPYTIIPSTLELQFDPVTEKRTGVITINNISTSPLTLTLDAHQRMPIPQAQITLEPNSSMNYTVSLPADDVDAFRGELWFIRDEQKEKLLIHADPEPAQLKLAEGQTSELDFGSVQKGRDATLKILVENHGGVAASLQPLSVPPFFIATPSVELVVEPKNKKEITLAFKPDHAGDYNKKININSTGGSLALTLKASLADIQRKTLGTLQNPALSIQNPHTPANKISAPVRNTGKAATGTNITNALTAPNAQAKPTPTLEEHSAPPKPSPTMTQKEKADFAKLLTLGYMHRNGIGIESMASKQSQVINPMQAVRAFEIGANYIVLGWLLPEENPPQKVRIEVAQRIAGKDLMHSAKIWVEVKDWKVAQAPEGAGAARIQGLNASNSYEFRVLGEDSEGKFSKASDILLVTTGPAPKLLDKLWVAIIILVLLAFAAWAYAANSRSTLVARPYPN